MRLLLLLPWALLMACGHATPMRPVPEGTLQPELSGGGPVARLGAMDVCRREQSPWGYLLLFHGMVRLCPTGKWTSIGLLTSALDFLVIQGLHLEFACLLFHLFIHMYRTAKQPSFVGAKTGWHPLQHWRGESAGIVNTRNQGVFHTALSG